MKKFKIFKDFKTKRQLKEENIALRAMLHPMGSQIHYIERDVRELCCSIEIENDVPTENIKEFLSYRLARELIPLTEYDVIDSPARRDRKLMKGTIYIAVKR